MSNANRLLKNSAFLYVRMFFLMAIGFYTTRVILEALGVEDLGIYNVVGSMILMFDFVSSGLTNSTQRFLNIGLGRNDYTLTNQYFSQSLILHLGFILFITLLGETIGLWFVYNKLVIPTERFDAAIIVYHLSVVALALRLFKICFESDIIAREKMSIYAYLSIFEGVAKLLICYVVISNQSIDKLVLYGWLLFLINLSVTMFNVAYCLVKYPESHFHWYNDKGVYKQLLGFVGLNSFGVIAWAVSKQGLNIILNMFFGPAVNGAKAVASNLERVITQFGSNLEVAVRPQITKYYAQGENAKMVELGEKGALYIFYVMFVVSLPFLFQTDDILRIWLKEVPDFTAGFVRILTIENLLYCIGNTFYDVTLATGKIKRTQLYGRLISFVSLPISYLMLHVYSNEYLPSTILALSSLAYSLFIIWDANTILHFGLKSFYKAVFLPIAKVAPIVLLFCGATKFCVSFDNLYIRFAFNSMCYCLFAVLVCFVCGVPKADKLYIMNILKNKLKR